MAHITMLQWMFKEYASTFIQFIDMKSTNKRRYKYSTEYCLQQICYVLQTNVSWKYLFTDCHYSTIFKRFQYWTRLGIFESFYEHILTLYVSKQLTNDPSHFKTLYIDGSMIKNRRGVDYTGCNHYDRHRQATKINVICDNNEVPLVAVFTPANISDNVSIEPCLIKLKTERLRLNNKYNHILVGDAGYIKSKKFKDDLYNQYKVKLVHPYRNNQTCNEQDKLNVKAEKTKERFQAKIEKCKLKEQKIIEDKCKSKEERLNDALKAKEVKATVKRERLAEIDRIIKEKKKSRKLKLKAKREKRQCHIPDIVRKSLNTKAEIEYLKERSKIEHVFCRIDQFKKLRDRDERTLSAYVSFNYIAMAILTIRFL